MRKTKKEETPRYRRLPSGQVRKRISHAIEAWLACQPAADNVCPERDLIRRFRNIIAGIPGVTDLDAALCVQFDQALLHSARMADRENQRFVEVISGEIRKEVIRALKAEGMLRCTVRQADRTMLKHEQEKAMYARAMPPSPFS